MGCVKGERALHAYVSLSSDANGLVSVRVCVCCRSCSDVGVLAILFERALDFTGGAALKPGVFNVCVVCVYHVYNVYIICVWVRDPSGRDFGTRGVSNRSSLPLSPHMHTHIPLTGVCFTLQISPCHSMPQYATVCHSMPQYATVCHGMPRYATVCVTECKSTFVFLLYCE
jgi:hypothetical protein